jgi:hypothetical protein
LFLTIPAYLTHSSNLTFTFLQLLIGFLGSSHKNAHTPYINTLTESPSDTAIMLRSLGLFLLLATASLADDLNYRVTMTRVNYTEDHCEYSNIVITAAIQSAASSSSMGLFNRVVTREFEDLSRRKLEDLYWCDEHCRCQTILGCSILNFCADSCTSCGCDRRLDAETEFLWPQEDVESSLSLEGVREEITAGGGGGIRQLGDEEDEDCPVWEWNRDRKLSYYELNEVMTCSANVALKGLARALILEENWCLGNPDELEVFVETYIEH